MKYVVFRTSNNSFRPETPKPCEKAEVLLNTDHPIWIEDPEERIVVWGVEFNTLEELMEFCSENGRVIVHEPDDDHWDVGDLIKDYPRLEIYDGYRE